MLKIVFFGTPEFAVPSLSLLNREYDVVAVVTSQEKQMLHGKKIIFSPVKKYALENGLKILQPEKLDDESFLKQLDELNADLYVVVAFKILPPCIFKKPRLGTINLHASLLPDYRGAAPINWVLINGETKTGLTTFFIDEKVDTGKIILQIEEKIFNCDTYDSLYDRLKIKGAKLLKGTVEKIEHGDINPVIQDMTQNCKKAPKIFSNDCKIDFNKTTEEVANFIRGLSSTPGAYTLIKGVRYKILNCYPINLKFLKVGEIASDKKNFLFIGTKDGVIAVKKIQPEGRKPMDVKNFLLGYWDKIKIF